MDMSSTAGNPYKRRKVQPLPRLDENTKKVLSRSYMVSGKVEAEIQNFSKLGLPRDTTATGWISIYIGDSLLKDMFLRVTPDENGRFKARINQMLIPSEEDEYLDINKISFDVGKFHVQHNLANHEKYKTLLRGFKVNIDTPEFHEEYYF